MPIRVYRYGLLPPTERSDEVRRQMLLAHRYRNTLTEIERGRRAAIRESMSAYADIAALEADVKKLDAACESAASQIKKTRASTRSRSDTDEQRQTLRDLRSKKSDTVRGLRERRAALRADASLVRRQDEINELAAELQRSARAHCGVYWGTYLLIEDAAQASRKMPMYDGAEPNDPRFSRWRGNGQIGVQLQGGMPVAEALGCEDTRMRIGPGRFVERPDRLDGAPRKHPSDRRFGKGAADSKTLRVRIGSDDRAPLWASWPMRMDRPMPASGRIKKATVSVRMRGPREEWSVEITVDELPRERRCGEGAVAVDLGWRKIGDEVRVLAWHGSDGRHGELRLTAREMAGLQKANELQSTRDQNFDAAVMALVAGVAKLAAPPWLSSSLAHVTKWSSQARLSALASRWKASRFDGDEAALTALESWRYHDFHLWSWQESQRLGALRHRRERYRVLAADLSSRYGTLVLESFDLRQPGFARRMPVDAGPENETARFDRQMAAPAEARLVLKNAFTVRGGRVEEVDPAHTTHDCNTCGHRNAWDQAESVYFRCSKCGKLWDQDRNAAPNILARRCEREDDASATGGARIDGNASDVTGIKETRWARAARLRKEKEVRRGTARNALANDAE